MILRNASLQLAGNAADGKFRMKLNVYNDAWRNISMDPIETNYLVVSDGAFLESPGDHLDSGLIMPRVKLLLHGLSVRSVLKHCWCYFPKMQTDDALFFKQFDLYTALPGHVRLHPASANLTVVPDAPVRQSMECHVRPFLPCIEPDAPPALPPGAMENEPASHVEHGTWDLLVVRVMAEWMQDDAYSEAFVGHAVLILSVKFAETGCRDPATTRAVVGLTVLRTPRESGNIVEILLIMGLKGGVA